MEGSGAIIRGMTQTRSEFNGRDSFTANSGRGLSFQDVSPELMGGVDIYKNQTADMIEGGIGGTVSLRTRKPFDASDRLFAISGDYSYGDLAEKVVPLYPRFLATDTSSTTAANLAFYSTLPTLNCMANLMVFSLMPMYRLMPGHWLELRILSAQMAMALSGYLMLLTY